MHSALCPVLKGRKPRASSCDMGVSRHLIPSGPRFSSGSRGAWAVCLLHERRGALPSSTQPRDMDYYLLASWPGQRGQRVGGSQWDGSAYVIVLSASSKPLPCDLEASWDSLAPPFDHSLPCERGKGTWPCNSIYFITDFMWVVPLAGIQWLHQTPLTHILSCPIGKAIKHESSRAPRLCMMYFEFSGSSQITLHLLVLHQKTEWSISIFACLLKKVNVIRRIELIIIVAWNYLWKTFQSLCFRTCSPEGNDPLVAR